MSLDNSFSYGGSFLSLSNNFTFSPVWQAHPYISTDTTESKIGYTKSEIDSLNKNNFISKSKSIESKIDSITDPEIKNKISKIYEDAIKNKNLNVSNYPVNPDDSLYQNLKTLEGKSLKDLLNENGSSISELNDKILTGVRAAGVGSREATVYSAMTLIGTVAEYGYKLSYYWGGTYQKMG